MTDFITLVTVFIAGIPFGLLIAAGLDWGGPCAK
jgi:hypothetical protein